MKCQTQDALCCWVFKLLKVVKGGNLPKDLAAWSKRRNQIGWAVLPKRWCRSYTRHHPCHKMSQGRRSPYYWHLRTVPSLIAVIAQATQYRFYRLKAFSSCSTITPFWFKDTGAIGAKTPCLPWHQPLAAARHQTAVALSQEVALEWYTATWYKYCHIRIHKMI
jgi:hypothetical protein